MIYLLIFVSKVIENALSTLRLIVVSNGRKLIGAILNLFISIVWIISTGLVVQNFKNIFNILSFALGCFTGSYLGSIMEGKLNLGSNMLIAISNNNLGEIIKDTLKDYSCYLLNGKNEDILFILVKRKERNKVLNMLYEIDKDITIISEIAHKLAHKSPLGNQ